MKKLLLSEADGLPDAEKHWAYNGADNLFQKENHQKLMSDLPEYAQRAYAFQMRMLPPLLHTAIRGFALDKEERDHQLKLLEKERLTRLARFIGSQIRLLVPKEDWVKMVMPKNIKVDGVVWKRREARYETEPLSPDPKAKTSLSKPLLTRILYDYLALPAKKGKAKKSKSGRSVDEEAIGSLLKEPKTKKVGAIRLLRAVLLYTEIEKQASYLRGPFRKGRITYVISPGKETFRIAGSKDNITADTGVLI